MALIKPVIFVVFEILRNLTSMQNVLNANKYWRKQNFENFPMWPYLYFWCSFRIIIWFRLIFDFLDCRKCDFIENETAQQCVTMRKRLRAIMAIILYKSFDKIFALWKIEMRNLHWKRHNSKTWVSTTPCSYIFLNLVQFLYLFHYLKGKSF